MGDCVLVNIQSPERPCSETFEPPDDSLLFEDSILVDASEMATDILVPLCPETFPTDQLSSLQSTAIQVQENNASSSLLSESKFLLPKVEAFLMLHLQSWKY